jgi:gliding motility-associated lipoprotein GldD
MTFLAANVTFPCLNHSYYNFLKMQYLKNKNVEFFFKARQKAIHVNFMNPQIFPSLFLVFLLSLISSCEPNYTPLPRTYFRIDLPEKEYQVFDSIYPYRFVYPTYGEFVPDTHSNAEPWWANISFPEFNATLHMSYKSIVDGNSLITYTEDGRNFVNRHIPKASGFQEKLFANEERDVYGILFEIRGKEAASPLQFFVTDSTKHFLRGSLYFNTAPNNDSLAPVIDFLHEDIQVMIESLEWEW